MHHVWRRWALSLAHAQLSELFWDKVMLILLPSAVVFIWKLLLNQLLSAIVLTWQVMHEQAFHLAMELPAPFNGLALFLSFAVWFILNLGVIMVMENLSSFLHALRLQWVEFQNKVADTTPTYG